MYMYMYMYYSVALLGTDACTCVLQNFLLMLRLPVDPARGEGGLPRASPLRPGAGLLSQLLEGGHPQLPPEEWGQARQLLHQGCVCVCACVCVCLCFVLACLYAVVALKDGCVLVLPCSLSVQKRSAI